MANQEDKVSAWLCIISFLIPVVGFIHWLCNRHELPERANACGIAALVSASLNLIAFFIAAIAS